MGTTVAVLSDAHLGDQTSLLEQDAVQRAVVATLGERSAGTLVLLGDTLDLDFGPLVTGVEGRLRRGGRRRPGLRALLTAVCQSTGVRDIVYVPGNHDYAVWDWEAQKQNALDRLARGETLCGSVLPSGKIANPFLAGLLPADRRRQFTLVFPDHVVEVAGKRILLTHGHYLDRKQTEGIALTDLAALPRQQRAAFRDNLFKACSQYQAFAHALAIRRSCRLTVQGVYRTVTSTWDRLVGLYGSIRDQRGRAPSSGDLPAIACYLQYCAAPPVASAFVYGHTHVPGRWDTPGDQGGLPKTPVYNSGSFVPPTGIQASMLFLSDQSGALVVDLVSFTKAGRTSAKRL